MIRILEGDCRDVLNTLGENSVDAIVTDPPYHLTTGKKGGSGEASVSLASPHGRARIGAGFMGMKWDGGDVAFQPATWAEAMRVLKPGGFLLAFGGTRTFHRLVCAIEDGGFEVRDMLAWLYGSGFPKGTDKAKIPDAWKGWNTALKPAIEPICMARKPMEGTLAENLKQWGTGALWMYGCRIAVDDDAYARNCSGDRSHDGTRSKEGESATNIRAGGGTAGDGRWPANVLHDGSDEVVATFPQASGAVAPVTGNEPTGNGFSGNVYGAPGLQGRQPSDRRDGGGSAARFFYCSKADRADRNEGLQGMPERQQDESRKAGNVGGDNPRNRGVHARSNHHPTVKPTDLMRYLCMLVTPPGGIVLDPFMGSGSTLKAAELEGFSAVGIELDPQYIEIARNRIAGDAPLFADVKVSE